MKLRLLNIANLEVELNEHGYNKSCTELTGVKVKVCCFIRGHPAQKWAGSHASVAGFVILLRH
jgi:hypothetical protein